MNIYLPIFIAAFAFAVFGRYMDYHSSLGFLNYGSKEGGWAKAADGSMSKPKAIGISVIAFAVIIASYFANELVAIVLAGLFGAGSLFFAAQNKRKKANDRETQMRLLRDSSWQAESAFEQRPDGKWAFKRFPWLYSDSTDTAIALTEVNYEMACLKANPVFPVDK